MRLNTLKTNRGYRKQRLKIFSSLALKLFNYHSSNIYIHNSFDIKTSCLSVKFLIINPLITSSNTTAAILFKPDETVLKFFLENN